MRACVVLAKTWLTREGAPIFNRLNAWRTSVGRYDAKPIKNRRSSYQSTDLLSVKILPMRARTGKIARLPAAIRDELNRRLHNGALGKDLVLWLNALPEAKQVLAERFASRPILEENLSQWRHGGFQDWLREEERRVRLGELAAEYNQLSPEQRTPRLAASIEERLTIELAEELERLATMKDRTERWKRLQRLSQEICRLQRSHNRGRELSLFQAKATTHSNPIRAC
jgi:hypothetical protein